MVLDTVGIQSKGCFSKQKEEQDNITAFIIDETLIQIGYTGTDDDAWLWVAIEPIHNRILGVSIISKHRNMLVAESFLKSLVKLYGKHIVYSDDCGSMVS